jgi:hypothetical protein
MSDVYYERAVDLQNRREYQAKRTTSTGTELQRSSFCPQYTICLDGEHAASEVSVARHAARLDL